MWLGCGSVAIPATDHIMFSLAPQPQPISRPRGPALQLLAREVVGPVHLANFSLAFPTRPVLFVKFHEGDCRLNGFFLRFQFELCIASDNFFGLREGSVDHGNLSTGKPDAGALRS